jgi:hypothetical protein
MTLASRKRMTEIAVANKSKQAIEQAEARFRKRAGDAASEIRVQRDAIQDKIARLRALRLAKEAADMQAAPAAKSGARKAR